MTGKRILAFIIDYLLFMLIMIVIGVATGLAARNSGNLFWYRLNYAFFALFFIKDSFSGQSFGRKKMKIAVYHNNQPAGSWRALARNLFVAIWPVELIMLLIKGKRLGDMATSCEVMPQAHKLPVTNWGKSLLVALTTFVAFYLLSLLLVSDHTLALTHMAG